MKIKANLLKYKDPNTGSYSPIPVVVSGEDIANKQDKVDNALNTSNKTVVGAINELSNQIVNEVNNRENAIQTLSREIVNQQEQINDLPNNEVLVQKVANKVPYVKVAEHPICVNSIAEMTDTSKMYVLKSDGMFYSYKIKEITTEGTKTPNFTNLMDDPKAYIKDGYRWSLSGGSWSGKTGCAGVVVPFIHSGGTFTIRVRNAKQGGGYNYVYYGSGNDNAEKFTTSMADGSWSTDSNGDSVFTGNYSSALNGYVTFTIDSTVGYDGIIVTLNEEITYTVTEGGTQIITEWSSTGISYNQPADYEYRVIANEEDIEELHTKTSAIEKRLDNMSFSNASDTSVFSSPAYSPVPQLPADGSETSDFDGNNITAQQAYDYMDVLCNKHKDYITKQTLGKDASEGFDYNRYILCKSYWKAWLKPNYPMMFAWINGDTVIYSVSCSPRVGDTMYTTPYVGTAYNTVTAVNCSYPDPNNYIIGTPSTRTVNGLEFTRYKEADVEPTIVYTKVASSLTLLNSGTVYDSSFDSLTTITRYTKDAITCADGITYTRYPFEDRKNDMSKPLSVFILANEHGYRGDSKIPSITLMRMAKDLCENRENPFLQWLKANAMLTIIPVGNPWGYGRQGQTVSGYYNSNGVNINRNYDTPGWRSGDYNYGGFETFGEYGGSEIETQYIMNTMHLCKAKVGLSMHGLGINITEPTDYVEGLMWQGCGYDRTRMTRVAEVLFSDYSLCIGGHTSGDQSYNYCGKSPAYIQYVGAVGGLNETPEWGVGSLDTFTPIVMEASYTQLLMFLQTWCEEAIEKLTTN